MTYDAFIRAHPEFSTVDPVLVSAMLAEATLRIDPAVWGTVTDPAIGWKAAEILDRHPQGGNSRLEPGEKSSYTMVLDEMRLELGANFLVAGADPWVSPGGWGWGG